MKIGNSATEYALMDIPLTKTESAKIRRMRRNDGWSFFNLSQPQGPSRGLVRLGFRNSELEPITLIWFLDRRRCNAIIHAYNEFVGDRIYSIPG